MRLIDADALNARLQKQVGSPTSDDLYEVNLCIIEAPTIAAIPVEWLRKWPRDLREGAYVRDILRDWQQEQEAR